MSRPIRNSIARTFLFAFACACLVSVSNLAGAQNPPPQPKFTVTKEASDKFGKGGSVEIKSDDKLRVHSETWRDQDGKIIEEHEIVYDEKGIKSESWSFPGQWKFIKEKYLFSDEPWDGKWSLYAEKQGEEKVPEEEKTDDVTLENDQPADVVGKKVEEFEQQFNRLGAIEYVKSIRDKEKPPEKPQPKETDPSKPGYDPTEQGTLPTKEVFTPSQKTKSLDPPKKPEDVKPSDTDPPKRPGPKTSDISSSTTSTLPAAQPKIVIGDIVKYLTNVKEFPDLYTVQFTAPNKDILEVYVPKFLYPGASLGSMHVIPSKASDGGLSFKNDKLQIGDTNVSIGDHKFGCEFKPGELGKFRMVDSQGRSLGGVDFPTTDIKDAPATRDFPTSATYGQLIGLDFPPLPNPPLIIGNGPDPFEVKIGDQEMPIIAANRFGLVTREDYNRPGLTTLQIRIGEKVITIPLRVLTLKLSAGSLLLSKYETTTVHIIAGGLEKLKAPAHMTIAASGSVKMEGATEVEIDPKMVAADGTYTTDRLIEAQAPGPFGVDVTVTVDKEPSDEQKVTNPTISSEKNDGGTDRKVSDAEKRINAHFDYVRQRRARMAVDYSGAGARETLENAFKKSGVGYSMRFVDELAKNGLSQLWSDEGMPAYTHAYNLLDQYSDVARKGGRISESFLKSLDDEMERWKTLDQAFAKQFDALVDLYTKQALIIDERHAIEEKYTDQLEELLKKENRQKGEIDALNRKQQEELKPVQERLEWIQKEIEKAELGTKALANGLDRFQPNDPDPRFKP